MEIRETQLKIQTTHPVYSMNELTDQTKTIWIACHGYGQLARYFVKRFDVLDAEENFIIAPQGLSRFYSDGNYGKVGATWMTKENRDMDLHNQRQYFDMLFESLLGQVDRSNYQLKLFGFSQGVTMIARLAAYKKLEFDQLVLWAGGMPHEQAADDWKYLSGRGRIDLVIGSKDEFFSQKTVDNEAAKIEELTGISPRLTVFDGKHEVTREVLVKVVV